MTITLLKGSDAVLLEQAAGEAVAAELGDADRNEVLDEFRGDDYDLSAVALAATTVSMFGGRVVVARNLGRFPAAESKLLIDLVDDVTDDVSLVLVWDKPITSGARSNPVPKKLADAVKGRGGDVVDTTPPSGKRRSGWFDEQFDGADVQLDRQARALVEDTLGEDVGRLPALLELVAAANPGEDRVGVEQVQPLLGESGGVPPWDLTDAIDKGRTAQAVELVRRMMAGGQRHPLQVMVTLQNHFERMLRLDGAAVHDEKAAAALLGMKGSTFPAKKALDQSSRMGSAKLARATTLLHRADVELRGATGAPPEMVLELLVARLSALSGGGRR
ncbi:MAG: DNA polymerase III subunit delta [Actinomycetia bacterium]|nr:DNA polymerase III subunit delta [Actinomycetes bacterium]